MKDSVEAFTVAALDAVGTTIGGGQIVGQIRRLSGEDGYSRDAMRAVPLAKE